MYVQMKLSRGAAVAHGDSFLNAWTLRSMQGLKLSDDILCQDSEKLLRGIHKYRQFYISSFITLRGADIYG